jgi:phage-related protein (TIGR01555 family)
MGTLNIGSRLKAWSRGLIRDSETTAAPPRFVPPDVVGVPAGPKLAMDDAMSDVYGYVNQSFGCHESFPGYPLLAQLTQIAEYRMLSEKTANAMVRKWIKLHSKGDGDKTKQIAEIEEAMTQLNVREMFGECAKLDGFFGRGQLFVDLGEVEGAGLETPLFKDKSVVLGKLRKLKVVEPMFTYPNVYNSSNPLADDYYKPRSWFVMGQKVHATRLLTFVSRPVPVILKPAYNFGGMSMTQLARPYVENWLKTRTSVNRMISNYSTSGLKTDMSTVLTGDSGEDLLARADLYSQIRDNQGLMLVDNNTEEFFQFNTPLSGLDQLQAQAQEHMASVASMPLPVLTGVTPSGLNASSEGDIRIFYDHVHDMQCSLFKDNLQEVLELVQLSVHGAVDPDIGFDFVSLWEQDAGELAANRKSDAEAAAVLVDIGAVSPEEVRQKLATDENSGYNGINVNKMPEPPEEPIDENPPSGDE